MSISKKTQQKLNAIILQAKAAGVPSFSIGFYDSESNDLVSHFEKLPAGEAVNIAGYQWVRAIQLELELHPEYTKEYVKIFTDSIDGFQKLLKQINSKVEKYKSRTSRTVSVRDTRGNK